MITISPISNCPCGSGASYATCCKPFHDGLPAGNALQLMRSRYSAYALNLIDYIIKTTHPKNPQYSEDLLHWAKEIEEFSLQTGFKKLTILEFKDGASTATVTFVVDLVQNEQHRTYTEKSTFEKIEGRWLYLNGVMIDGNN